MGQLRGEGAWEGAEPEGLCALGVPSSTVVETVLQRTHQLQGCDLDVSPHYDFLEPSEDKELAADAAVCPADGETSPLRLPLPDAATRGLLESPLVLQELAATVPACTLRPEGAGLCISGGDAAGRRQLLENIAEALQGVAREHLSFPAGALAFLRRADVGEHLVELLAEQGLGAHCAPAKGEEEEVLVVALQPSVARRAAAFLASALASFYLPVPEEQLLALALPRWAEVQAGLRCCEVRLAESGRHLEGLTLRGLEEENMASLVAFLRDSMPDESVVPMEAGTLRYLQLYYQEILAGMADVTLLPLEGPDVTGLRVRLLWCTASCKIPAHFCLWELQVQIPACSPLLWRFQAAAQKGLPVLGLSPRASEQAPWL